MIVSFADKLTERLWNRKPAPSLHPEVQRKARLKLEILNAAADLTDLRIPPGNRLETIRGDRNGQYSIHIDRRWRICFEWSDGKAMEVESVDYH
ncbi:MAG: type II toxin-antitoxin system RelE/ParE family toxin [Corynebacterium glucuronolyticum]|nr:type II toxin-antitoxin system RelE/ParE family toxin [Corynebacterium glucuronolyticum]MDD7585457.1 type II toxin-antitoxin system RelE/ParE family toxin [Mycobacteriaceae bacterium]MDY5835205.1 type II toxin-antitoxin system RelE/ParE family toxin [Corynebacterium glucuronolyticum]